MTYSLAYTLVSLPDKRCNNDSTNLRAPARNFVFQTYLINAYSKTFKAARLLSTYSLNNFFFTSLGFFKFKKFILY